MTPTHFKGANITFAKNQPQYHPLPTHYDRADPRGTVTSCYRLTWRERFKVLFTGRVYFSVLTFHQPLQPQLPSVDWTPPAAPVPAPKEAA